MNRYLLLSAAAILAGTSGAATAKKEFTYCGMTIFEAQRGVFAVKYSDGSNGQGLARKTAEGKFVELSDNYFGNYRSVAVSYDLSRPFKSGGTWAQWVEFSGTTSFEANTGTCNASSLRNRNTWSRNVKALVAAHRAARTTR